jgi:hypothetical protein
MKRTLVCCLWLACTLAGQSQSTDVWQVYKEKFSQEPAIFIERSETLNILLEGDSLKVYSDIFEDVLHLKEQADFYSGRRVYGSDFSQIANLKAKTLIWDKSRYKELSVSDIKKNSDRSSGVFYDDSYYYSFNFPAVTARNRTQLQYRENMKEPRFISGFVFASYLAQVKSSFVIRTSKEVEIAYEVLHDPEKKIKFKKTEKGGFVYYEWTTEEVPVLRNDADSPPIRHYAPHLVCHVKSYRNKAGKVNVLSSLDDLYGWYGTFIKNLNKETSPELLAIVEKLKTTSTSEIDLVKKIFYWVQDNIQYIAFEQGMRGLIPHSGTYVCEKRYGDCKDMANMIVNMLQLADIKAYHTWIGTRDLPYSYTSLPTPIVDNHMIATYISKEGTYYFLDATSDHTPFGFPSSMIQGKEALIGLTPDRYEVRRVPAMPKEKNLMVDSVSITVNGNELKGKGKSALHGYPKVFGGYELDRAEQEDVKRYVTKLVVKGSNKFFLDDYSIGNLENRDQPTRISYTFRLGDYFQKLGDEIYINLNLNKDHYNDFINAELRKAPKETEYQFEKHDVIELAIPPGYKIDYLPPSARHEGKFLGLEVTYTALPGKVILAKKLYVNYLLLQPEEFELWNSSVKLVSEAYKESIILKKK